MPEVRAGEPEVGALQAYVLIAVMVSTPSLFLIAGGKLR
jgi:hypothetical protein